MAKKVTAPKTYDPGKGRPKEYLAYLNQREMAYLRSINGNNMERGPRNLPSFPPDDAVGSSSKAGSGRSSGSGNTSGVGGGGGGGGGSTGSRGSSTGSVGSKSGSNAPGNIGGGAGGQRGAGSNYGPGSGRPGTTSSSGGGNKGPASPMGGQGTSMSRDTKARQEAQVRDAIAAVKNTPAFRGDASSGGIRSINVGPMGTPVNVGRSSIPSNVGQPAKSAPAARPSTSISAQFPSYRYNEPLKPGVLSQEDINRRVAEMNRIEQEMRDMGLINKPAVTRTGSPIDAGGVPTKGPNEALKGTGYGEFTAPTTYRDKLGFEVPSGLSSELPEPKIPDRVNVDDVYGPVRERVLEVENVPPERPTYAAGTYTDPYNVTPPERVEVVGGTGMMAFNAPDAPTSVSAGDFTPRQRDKVYGSPRPGAKTRGIGDIAEAPANADDVYGPKNVSQEVQQEMADIDKLNKRGIKGIKSIPVLGNVVKAGDALRGLITGKNTAEADADLKRAYMQGSSAQKAELEAKYPNLTKFAQQAGLEPQLPMSNYESWRQKSFGFGGSGTGTSTVGGGSTDRSDIGSGGKAEPVRPEAKSKDTAPKAKKTEPKSGSRPEIYYMWDAGVNIPSSGDSDYTLYQQYLAERRAAQAAFGMR